MRIAVIGAGIGGLAAAVLLIRAGHDVQLIERFGAPKPIGSGLVVQPVGLAVLDALGAGHAARALGAPIRRMEGFAGCIRVLDVAYRADAPGLAMHRGALFAVLWQTAVAAGVPVIGDFIVIAAPLRTGKRWLIGTNGAEIGPFDLVVDASGAGSRLSPLQARALPFGAVWGQVPWPEGTSIPRDQLSQRYEGAHKMAGVMPIGQLPGDPTPLAAVFWSLPRAALDGWADTDKLAWRAEVAAFWPAMADFMAQMPDMTVARYAHGTLRRPYAPGLVFIGDAAHRASPQLGQGANMALLDAMALSVTLRQGLDDALPAYAAMRRWHVRAYQGMSAAFTPMYQSASRSLPLLRDRLLTPASRIPPVPRVLTALVSGDMIPPLAGLAFP